MCTMYVGTNGTLSCEYDADAEHCDCECSPGFFRRPDGKGCTAGKGTTYGASTLLPYMSSPQTHPHTAPSPLGS